MKDSNCSPYSGPGSSAYYSSPDRPNDTVAANAHQYADGGDPTFYMILDLASSIDIDRLRVRNGNSVMAPSWGEYCVKDYEVSVSDSVNSGYSAPISGTLINNELFNQDILVGLTGRYIKFKFLTYCEWGVVIRWVEVLMAGQTGDPTNASCPNDVPAPSPPTKSPSLTPTTSPTSSPITPAPTGSPTVSPSNSPTGSPTNSPTGSQGAGGAAAGQSTSGAAASTSAADSLYYPDWTKSNGGCKTGGGQPQYMTLASSTWMFATLDACCSRYYSWMLNECKGTSGAAPSGLWYPGSYVSRLFFQTINLVSDRSSFADWMGPDDTCKNDGNEPQYMDLNPGAWMHSSKQACCKANFGWMLNECLGSSAGATSKWFIDWDDFKCKRDCAVGTGASCGGRAESWDELFDTRLECCSNKAAWNPTDCLVD
ncbi:hypothetical protein THAOC_17171 [Thalassiosira oceanica]|uniref:Uncharacterized protein n=1 Tax=Thalassiosira oceanica TaxID=159749 RepID=K0SBC4_THAOC|nr:hypothetical protein THAOC_17171 [Thalassiosira oceanica]|eukprot:EJK62224.1 hypothetical protein THAOC_17171 [Thalassiosira oceanica]